MHIFDYRYLRLSPALIRGSRSARCARRGTFRTLPRLAPPQPGKDAVNMLVPWGQVLPAAGHLRCRIVRQVTIEMVLLVAERVPMRRDRRRVISHARQISMYVSHVVLRIPIVDIAHAFGLDRSTVNHACAVVEDRRDHPAFDDFITAVERVVMSMFGADGGRRYG